jgi:16S rRNA (uracil1498-N3)-methyltransferase
LEEAPSRHLSQVLRFGPGSRLALFNGDGREAEARLVTLSRRGAELEVLGVSGPEPLPHLKLTLAQGISKGERMDFALQKAVELGAQVFVPLFTERSVIRLEGERLARRLEHWQGVAIAACEQSGRRDLVRVAPASGLTQWLASQPGPGIFLHPGADQRLVDLQPPCDRLCLLVGPEGGLSEAETRAAEEVGLAGIRLGPRILRTETAPLAALAAIQTLWGDFR